MRNVPHSVQEWKNSMVDWDSMHGAFERAHERDIVGLLETEIRIADYESDQFLVNLYGQAIKEIQQLRDMVDTLKAEVQYYQSITKGQV